jgi:hypothetical protein
MLRLIAHQGEPAGIWRHAGARVLSGIPKKFEEIAAVEFSSATYDLILALSGFPERRRIGKLHLDSRDRRYGEIAAIKRGRD